MFEIREWIAAGCYLEGSVFCSFGVFNFICRQLKEIMRSVAAIICVLFYAKQEEIFAQWTRECLESVEKCQELLKENSARNFSDKTHDKVSCQFNTTCSSKLIFAWVCSWKRQHRGRNSTQFDRKMYEDWEERLNWCWITIIITRCRVKR